MIQNYDKAIHDPVAMFIDLPISHGNYLRKQFDIPILLIKEFYYDIIKMNRCFL